MALLALAVPFTAAQAAKPTTYIVIDAASGQILSEQGADSLNYPASLTKMMTLFLTFSALEQHRITLQTEFPVSYHAASQAPSKLGLVPGSSISVHDAILAIVTHSANDAAVVLAEGLGGGSEQLFVARMNGEARALGMTRTNFRNANGLPDRFQYTTARDLSRLALALYRTFPREYGYFSTESFTYRGTTYGNHNHLMEAFQGMDGIKTGFINASGFNLAASAVRNNRRLVGVIMGGRTASSRDMEMAELLDDAFARRGAAPTRMAAAELPPTPVPHVAPIQRTSLALRNGDGLSAISQAATQAPAATQIAPTPAEVVADNAEVEEASPPVHHHYRHAASRHEHHHVVRVASHSARHPNHRGTHHHGIMLASYEREETIAPRGHHYRQAGLHGHRTSHRYASRHRAHATVRLAAAHHRVTTQGRFAKVQHDHYANTRRLAHATTTASHTSHGVACGGWAGHNRPCPPAQRLHHGGLRSATLRRMPLDRES